jgi:tRNA-splicing ligase RtcB
MLADIKRDNAPEQVANVATIPGIVSRSMAMPDIHWGYGFPIGGVAATEYPEGVLSPGGVGFDINCGVRLIRTRFSVRDVLPKLKEVIDTLFVNVPSGVGSKAKVRLSLNELENVLELGARWAVEQGYGWVQDLEVLEEDGCLQAADPAEVSARAKERGKSQVGSLGAGNHFLEIQKVSEVYDAEAARAMGIREKDQIVVMVHTGSRGCGHQICTDHLRTMEYAVRKYNISLPDRQLACAPGNTKEAESYFAAMACAANFAWANRQMIVHWVRESFEAVFGEDAEALEMHTIYDVCHNIAKVEEHELAGKRKKLWVHRKGATRAFPPGHKDIPAKYSEIGQPVLIPGDMGTASYVLVGTEMGKETFYSTCHGAGRVLSRHAALRRWRAQDVERMMSAKNIYVHSASRKVLVEECPDAYKNVDDVVDATHGAGISKKVAKLLPLGVVKG